ncbi:MAG: hypothetical protein D6718_01485 [Acidobacteria bacterium]|nr:MAG: hypothetical protein D6718_01485 [Acidobacteriota bacterium]
MTLTLGPRRGEVLDVAPPPETAAGAAPADLRALETLDGLYRPLCAILYNYVPRSGHPGGSISCGRFAAALLFDNLDHDLGDPWRSDADLLCYAAGHKALGLYALWALRDEIARVAAPHLLPEDRRARFRLEDLLGFRRNPTERTPLLSRMEARPLDGHPTPAIPFVPVATGASGVGLAAAVGLALGALDVFGSDSPRVHVIEGEGGLTPGRASEALAAAGTARLGNLVVHVDWNQASIDTDRVCREADRPGDYVQWDPAELFALHDWNVVRVPDGRDLASVLAGQRLALSLDNGQPTAIVYRTVKGWRYGITGRASHGAGHGMCSDGFFDAVMELTERYGLQLPRCDAEMRRCERRDGGAVREECFWEALGAIRSAVESERETTAHLAGKLEAARERLEARARKPRPGAPRVESVYETAVRRGVEPPESLRLEPGATTTLRGELGRVLRFYNEAGAGALVVAAADLLGSTSVDEAVSGFAAGFFDARENPASRRLAVGGICEDGITGVLSGLSAFGRHIGVASSYAAFIAPLGHVAARLHAIGAQALREATGAPYRTLVVVCAHAGLETGEDGPTHADPQALQLVQGNFPPGLAVTLTPWEPQEIWPLVTAALAARPALIFPFVTRPPERVPDRAALGLPPASAAAKGIVPLRTAAGRGDGTVVLQGSRVTSTFVTEVLPRLEAEGIDLNAYCVTSAELFDRLPRAEREHLYPEARAREAMGITGFTLPTMERWILSRKGREATLHPFRKGGYPGSGPAPRVLAQAGLDAESQYRAVLRYVASRGRNAAV